MQTLEPMVNNDKWRCPTCLHWTSTGTNICDNCGYEIPIDVEPVRK